MNEIEITIKTNFKTTLKVGKFLRRIFYIISVCVFSTQFSPNLVEKFGEFFQQNNQTEIAVGKNTQEKQALQKTGAIALGAAA